MITFGDLDDLTERDAADTRSLAKPKPQAHEWRITSWEYDDTFFRCERCGVETHQQRGYPDPLHNGPCAASVEK